MSDTVIRVENLSKKYVISHRGERGSYSTFRESIASGVKSLARRFSSGDPTGPSQEEFWALKDVSFEVKRGEVVGIIGRNGAGNSTLLKVLSRITEPTSGRITIDGRMASLLEVGTGFHPELTGRENVFLNGSILGMSRSEVRRKFDEIVAFAEVEKFLDTPVKRYSSGMYVRLAFAVAAHLETEIMVIDEVLAVGDSSFQKKVLGKMGEVASGGRTVLFVSHQMSTLLAICQSGLLLQSGRVRKQGDIKSVARDYMVGDGVNQGLDKSAFRGPLKTVVFEQILLNGEPIGPGSTVSPGESMAFHIKARAETEVPDFRTTFSLFSQGVRLVTLHDTAEPRTLPAGPFEAMFKIPAFFLRPGEYSVALGGRRVSHDDWIWGTDLSVVQVSAEWGVGYDRDDHGLVNLTTGGHRSAPTVGG